MGHSLCTSSTRKRGCVSLESDTCVSEIRHAGAACLWNQTQDIDLAAWQPTQAARLLHACRPEAGNLSTQGHSLESGTSSQRRPLPSATFSQTGDTWPGCLATRRGCVSLESGTPGLRISRLLSNRGGNVHIETLNAPVACPETAFPSPERYVIWLTPDRGPGSNHLHKVL